MCGQGGRRSSAERAAEDGQAFGLQDDRSGGLDGLSSRSGDELVAGEEHRQHHRGLLRRGGVATVQH